MRRQKALFPITYLVLIILFLVGCSALVDTSTPANDFATDAPAAELADTSQESPAATATMAESTNTVVVQTVVPSCDANDPPIADAGGPYSAIMDQGQATVNFDASNSTDPDGTIANYLWLFGDNSGFGNGQNISHTYSNAGIFEIRLAVSDNCDGITQDTTEVTIMEPTLPSSEAATPLPSTAVPSDTPIPPTISPSDPDLVIQSFNILQHDWLITGGFAAVAEVVVKNIGDGPASAFDVGIVSVNRESKFVSFGFSYDPAFTAALAPGQEVRLTGETGLDWHGHYDITCADGNYDAARCAMLDENTLWLVAIADYCEGFLLPDQCAVEEFDEANNKSGPVVIEKPQISTSNPTETPVTPPPPPTEEPVTPPPPPPTEEVITQAPVVIIMDSANSTVVYHQEKHDTGWTNADDIIGILANLPIETRKETTSPQWQVPDYDRVRSQNPDLILIHLSAFYDPNGSNHKFNEFIDYMKGTPTIFIFYSRSPNITNEEQTKSSYENSFGIPGRLDILYVKYRWDQDDVPQRLQNKVRRMLGLN